jgi:hypothetical protein
LAFSSQLYIRKWYLTTAFFLMINFLISSGFAVGILKVLTFFPQMLLETWDSLMSVTNRLHLYLIRINSMWLRRLVQLEQHLLRVIFKMLILLTSLIIMRWTYDNLLFCSLGSALLFYLIILLSAPNSIKGWCLWHNLLLVTYEL